MSAIQHDGSWNMYMLLQDAAIMNSYTARVEKNVG